MAFNLMKYAVLVGAPEGPISLPRRERWLARIAKGSEKPKQLNLNFPGLVAGRNGD